MDEVSQPSRARKGRQANAHLIQLVFESPLRAPPNRLRVLKIGIVQRAERPVSAIPGIETRGGEYY